ncbi:MAG: hypothetical protein CMK07_14440 [Ponticaulis sp.]|nr:hypothetical protein [Ponticaulis sp.]
MPTSETGVFSSLLEQAAQFAEGLPHPDLLAVFGLAAMAILSVLIAIWLIGKVLSGSRRLHQYASMRAMRDDGNAGTKVMVASVGGVGGMSVRKAVLDSLERHLPMFNFGSPFYLGSCPIDVEATDFALSKTDHETLLQTFEKSGADLIIWGEARGRAKGNMLCFSTPDMVNGESAKGFVAVNLMGNPSDWGEDERRAIAYVAGRRLRPSLGKPADFRADRLLPIIQSMETLLTETTILTGKARTELDDDFAAGALHIGEQLKDPKWLEKAAEYRTRALAAMKPGDDQLRWSQAKIDLGRAMILQCEHKFEPLVLQEAMNHLREGIEATKSDRRMKLADTGLEAFNHAETMLANRRRFSIRWNT